LLTDQDAFCVKASEARFLQIWLQSFPVSGLNQKHGLIQSPVLDRNFVSQRELMPIRDIFQTGLEFIGFLELQRPEPHSYNQIQRNICPASRRVNRSFIKQPLIDSSTESLSAFSGILPSLSHHTRAKYQLDLPIN
jgi:hypothetical protein